METLKVKPLENEDTLETVKKYVNFFILTGEIHLFSRDNTPLGKFIKENPEMFYSPKRRTDNF